MKTLAPSRQKSVQQQLDVLLAGGTEIITIDEMEEKLSRSLAGKKPLKVKQGIDPTSPDVHIGHMVPFRKMRQFQDLGHTGIIIIGDYTAQIGDPTDRNAERTFLQHEETLQNAETYQRQIFRVVDGPKTEVVWQSSWFTGFTLGQFLDVSSDFSVAHLLTHETFRKRLAPGFRLSLHEILYPVLQAWDSVQVRADVELGGTDQKFNILCGRDLMKARGLEPQVALLVPLLPGTDGRKMSKSFGNHIPVESTPEEKIGKVMSISDELVPEFMHLGLGLDQAVIKTTMDAVASGKLHPRQLKMDVAKGIAEIYHPKDTVVAAARQFDQVFTRGAVPDDIRTVSVGSEGIGIIALLTDFGLAPSTSEARRLVGQNAVSIEGTKIRDIYFTVVPPPSGALVIKVGKRRFLRVAE